MPPAIDKRSEARRRCYAEVMWAYFNTMDFHAARMVNVSRGGGYFETGQPALPGASVFIRVQKVLDAADPSSPAEALRSAALGEVKWCRDLSGGGAQFGVGFRYHIPV